MARIKPHQSPEFVPGPVFMVEGPTAPPSGSPRRVAAILVPAVVIVILVVLGVVFLSGMVRLGTPAATAISLASKVDSTGKPLDSKTRFAAQDAAVYCCANVRAFHDTRLESRWYQSGVQISTFKSTFGRMAGAPPARFLTSRGRVCFKLPRPGSGWVGGPYSVKVLVNGKEGGKRDFLISEAKPEGMIGLRYTDPSSGFSIVVPEGWLTADKASLQGALAGFLAPTQQAAYPPRFAISLTDYASVDVSYLNDVVKQAGAKPEELFGPYAIGLLAGARRTFEWDYKDGAGQYRLRTIQVVVQSGETVYSIDCHSLAADFAANEPTFNAIINTFQ